MSDREPMPVALSPLKRAVLALDEAHARIRLLESGAREPIAIVGAGCRMPGGIVDLDTLWQSLALGRDLIGPMPPGRWDLAQLYDADPDRVGRIAAHAGGFLDQVDRFDPELFGIAPREAASMDPQQRLMLEVVWESLEHAGLAPDRLSGSATGVFLGVTSSDYSQLQLQAADPGLLDSHYVAGIAHSILSGRVSYVLGLQGPSMSIDTACSSSLVAIHLAMQSLRAGECAMALAGGVNLILSPENYFSLSRARMLAPDGRCKTFDASADGFARAEGCAVVVLKRLADAIANRDRVLAVIRGSAVNQDGPSSGLTAPNGPAQEAVIRAALANGGVRPGAVSYVEAHGTGTQLGDPLEVQALGNVFGPGRGRDASLWIGSLKTNTGHMEAAAGVGGLLKVICALRHGQIPPHLHFRRPSTHIPWDRIPVQVPTALIPWRPGPIPRIAGVSSFGFSGTNAHLVIEEPPVSSPVVSEPDRPAYLVTVSGRHAEARDTGATRLADYLDRVPAGSLADVAYSANSGRAQLGYRAAIVARSIPELKDRLRSLGASPTGPGVALGVVRPKDQPRVAFLFTGQGAQYAGMGRELYLQEPVFRAAVDAVVRLAGDEVGKTILAAMGLGGSAEIEATGVAQPALFAVQYGLCALWRSIGVEPSVVVGHSVGEFAAAVTAGALSVEDAVPLVVARGHLMQALPPGGSMAAVAAPEETVRRMLDLVGGVDIAAVNGPAQIVISGPDARVQALADECGKRGVKFQRLVVSHAFHSDLMTPMLAPFGDIAAGAACATPRIRVISTVTGVTAGAEFASAGYWTRQIREPVRFADAAAQLVSLGVDVAIEIGPHPVLTAFGKGAFPDASLRWIGSLKRGSPEWIEFLAAAQHAYTAGVEIQWSGLGDNVGRGRLELPAYPFQRSRYWFEATKRAAPLTLLGGHPILGRRIQSPLTPWQFQAVVSADEPRYLADHVVLDQTIVPATAFLDMMAVAGFQWGAEKEFDVVDVEFRTALSIGEPRWVSTTVEPLENGDGRVTIQSAMVTDQGAAGGPWTVHALARLSSPRPMGPDAAVAEWYQAAPVAIPVEAFYSSLAERGLRFGPTFRGLDRIATGDGVAVGRAGLVGHCAGDAHRYRIHPVLLDACLQLVGAGVSVEPGEAYVPVAIDRFTCRASGPASCHARVEVAPAGSARSGMIRADVTVVDDAGAVLAVVEGLRLQRTSKAQMAAAAAPASGDGVFDVTWVATPLASNRDSAPDPAAITDVVTPLVDELLRQHAATDYEAFRQELEALAGGYVERAFASLGWAPQPGDRVDPASLQAALGILPRHRRLLVRLLAILAEVGVLARDERGWVVLRQPAATDLAPIADRIQAAHPVAGPDLEMTVRCGVGLPLALVGRVDPLELLFPGGSTETAERMYGEAPMARVFNELMAKAATVLGAAAGPLEVLEVGGGTGGTTRHVLPALRGDTSYTFTDIGPLFVSRAQERFGARDRTTFAALDIGSPPTQQGFRPGSFDVVVASNVLHATKDLRTTLAHVRGLLRDGGTLLLLEVTAPQRWFDITVGLLPGWWSFSDTDLRPDYATLTQRQWASLLGEAGFGSTSAIGGSPGDLLPTQAFIVAQAERAPTPKRWVVWADAGGVSCQLSAGLRGRGDQVVVVHRHDATDAGADAVRVDLADRDALRALLGGLGAVTGHLYLRGLDDATAADIMGPGGGAAGALGVVQTALELAGASTPRIWFVTRGGQKATDDDVCVVAAQTALAGFGRVVALEHPELRPVVVDLDPAQPDAVALLLQELDRPADEVIVAYRGGARLAPRLTLHRTSEAPAVPAPFQLTTSQRGSLDRLALTATSRRSPGPGEVEIAVHAVGLNFKDVLNVLDLYPGDPGPLGGECAGVVTAVGTGVTGLDVGTDVLALGGGSFASHVVTSAHFVRRRPPGVDAVRGAAFPIAYLTAHFCLHHLAELRSGETILIHAATGGVGLAAVHLAQRVGARVIATAGSPRKRAYLEQLGVAHVLDSRTPAFAQSVRLVTGGRGVDVVLNSLSGEMVDASFRCLAAGGRFVEIGKRDIWSPERVAAETPGVRYWIVDWGETARSNPELIGMMFDHLLADLEASRLPGLPVRAFPVTRVGAAFRYMAQARQIGKIVVAMEGGSERTLVRPDATYLVSGGLTGLGLLSAQWLATQGAKHLVLFGRRPPNPASVLAVEALRKAGVDVGVETVDVSDRLAVGRLLESVRRSGPPIRGLIHAAGVLDDGAILQQNAERFDRVLAPKVAGAAHLDELTRADGLDWFVLYGSVAGTLGSRGQSNHAAANAFLDGLAEARHLEGLPALVIDWGVWSDVGTAAARGVDQRAEAAGLGVMSPERGLATLHRLMRQQAARVVAAPLDASRLESSMPDGPARRLLELVVGRRTGGPARERPSPAVDLATLLREAAPSARRRMIQDWVRERAAAALGVAPDRLADLQQPLGELGLDSLLAVELRNVLGRAIGRTLSATLLFDYPTIETLTDYFTREVFALESAAPIEPGPVATDAGSLVAALEDLSDEEAARLVAQRLGKRRS